MKTMTLILALSAGLVAAILVAQWHSNASLRQQLATLTRQNEEQSRQIEELETASRHSEGQRAELLRSNAVLEEQVRAQKMAVALAPPTNSVVVVTNRQSERPDRAGFGGFLSKIMQDPDAKKFIQNQQRLMMDQMYAPLIKQLGLSPEQAAQFKDMLAENAMHTTEKATAMFGGAATNPTQLAAAMAEEQKAFEQQVKTFLGEDRFANYKEYQETVGDRTQLNMFRQQTGGDYPITDTQTEQLLTLIKEERRAVAAQTGQSAVPSPGNRQNLEAMLSQDQAEKLFQSQETVNQRVFERARMILSPDQLQSFGAFQSNQLQMMRMGMNMARNMLAPGGAEAATFEQNP